MSRQNWNWQIEAMAGKSLHRQRQMVVRMALCVYAKAEHASLEDVAVTLFSSAYGALRQTCIVETP